MRLKDPEVRPRRVSRVAPDSPSQTNASRDWPRSYAANRAYGPLRAPRADANERAPSPLVLVTQCSSCRMERVDLRRTGSPGDRVTIRARREIGRAHV